MLEYLKIVPNSDETLPEDDKSSFTRNLSANVALLCIALGGVLVMVGAFMVAKRVPRVMKIYESMREKLMYGAFLTFYVKSYLKLYAEAFMGVNEEDKS